MDVQAAPTATGRTYRLRPGVWDQIAEKQGWNSNVAAARVLGLSHTQVGRVLAGEHSPGERFMAALMSVLPQGWSHEDVFELIEGEP